MTIREFASIFTADSDGCIYLRSTRDAYPFHAWYCVPEHVVVCDYGDEFDDSVADREAEFTFDFDEDGHSCIIATVRM